MYSKTLQLISASMDFLLLPTFSPQKDMKQYIPFSDIRLEITFRVEVKLKVFSFPINNVAYFAFRNFNTPHITTILNHGKRVSHFG